MEAINTKRGMAIKTSVRDCLKVADITIKRAEGPRYIKSKSEERPTSAKATGKPVKRRINNDPTIIKAVIIISGFLPVSSKKYIKIF
jgi:hypothetical protein